MFLICLQLTTPPDYFPLCLASVILSTPPTPTDTSYCLIWCHQPVSHLKYPKENSLLTPNPCLLNFLPLIKSYYHPFSKAETVALCIFGFSFSLTIPTPSVKSNRKFCWCPLQPFDSVISSYPLQLSYLGHHHLFSAT